MNSNYLTTHNVNENNYTSSTLIPSTLNPTVVDTVPGSGDVYLDIIVTSGTIIELKVNIGYHSH